ncbi:MAG: DnaD domain protein [Dehalococcoidia bacterium]|nr:DnaD domain protein [Dehalococcoidia bacterium]
MVPFAGFPNNSDATPVPNLFFSTVLQELESGAELQCALRFFYLLHRKKGWPRYVTLAELEADTALLAALAGPKQEEEGPAPPIPSMTERLDRAVDGCVAHGILLRLTVEENGRRDDLLFLNAPREQEFVGRAHRGEVVLPERPRLTAVAPPPAARPSIVDLYEKSIGLVITPRIAEELKDAEQEYPAEWVGEAFDEAVRQNKRSWAYVAAILRRWKEGGKGHGGTTGRRAKAADPKDYIREHIKRYGRYP